MITFKEYYILEEGEKLDNLKKWAKIAGLTVAGLLTAAGLLKGTESIVDYLYDDPYMDRDRADEIVKLIQQMAQGAEQRGMNLNLPQLGGQTNAPVAQTNAPPAAPAATPVADNIQAIMAHIRGEEGIRLDSYNDHLGFRTVGIGHRMTRDARDYRVFQQVIQFNRQAYDDLRAGRRDLNDNDTENGIAEGNRRAVALFQSDVEWKIGVATRVLSHAHIDIDLLPANLQIVFVDMTFQGAIGRRNEPIQRALQNHNWEDLDRAILAVATSPRFRGTGVETRLNQHRATISANIEGLNAAIIPENNR